MVQIGGRRTNRPRGPDCSRICQPLSYGPDRPKSDGERAGRAYDAIIREPWKHWNGPTRAVFRIVTMRFTESLERTMFKHGWVEARAKVIDASFGDKIQAGPLIRANYVVDVGPPDGQTFRTLVKNVQAVGITQLQEGDQLTVTYNPRDHGQIEIVEKGDPRFDPKAADEISQERITNLLTKPPGTPAPTQAAAKDPDDAKLDALLEDLEGN